jgi:hypothetical protein
MLYISLAQPTSLIVSIVECETFISDYKYKHRDQKKILKSSLCDLSNEK